jgi:hypothetical protein
MARGRRLWHCSKVGSYSGYTGDEADMVATVAPDPNRPFRGRPTGRIVAYYANRVASSVLGRAMISVV